MINIKLYTSSADNRKIDKSSYLKLVREFNNCVLKKDTSIMDISIDLQVTDMSELSNVNYVYVPELNTYYYINDIKFLTGNVLRLECHEDVLMTYKTDILNLKCVIARQEHQYNSYLDDPTYKVVNYNRIQTYQFPDGLTNTNPSFVLAVAGGE